MAGGLRSVIGYRYFIVSSIRNELLNPFARSRLGGLWMLIQPLVMVSIYAFVLSAVLRSRLEGVSSQYAYAIYLTSGMLAWSLFNDVLMRCLNLFVGNANLLKKMLVPKTCLPLIAVGTALINNLLLLLAIVLIFVLLGHRPTAALLWLPLLMALLLLLALGLGLIVAVLNVFMRDTAQVVTIVMQCLFWFTPIIYPAVIIPEHLRHWLQLNPLYPLVRGYQDVLAYQQAPALMPLLGLGVFALALCALGWWMVRRANAEMVDEL
jgi:lipopolysaccharide transport system permease protein